MHTMRNFQPPPRKTNQASTGCSIQTLPQSIGRPDTERKYQGNSRRPRWDRPSCLSPRGRLCSSARNSLVRTRSCH